MSASYVAAVMLLAAVAGCGASSSQAEVRPASPLRLAWPADDVSGVLPVEVTGREFAWEFRYPGADGRFGTADDLTCRRDLHLPAGRDIELKLTSADYIYTLELPDLGLEEIAVPELFHSMKFRTADTGSFRLLADPICALRFFHDEEMGRVTVEQGAAFERWLATQR